jgi:hypothetical protein
MAGCWPQTIRAAGCQEPLTVFSLYTTLLRLSQLLGYGFGCGRPVHHHSVPSVSASGTTRFKIPSVRLWI